MQTVKVLILSLVLTHVAGNGAVAQQVIDHARKFDEFYGSNWESATARLDEFALDIQNNPNAVGVLIVYGGQRRQRGEARAWAACLKNYLVHRRGIDAQRIVTVNGGYRETLTVDLWETSNRNHVPNPEPHVKPKDVRYKGGGIRRWRRLCKL